MKLKKGDYSLHIDENSIEITPVPLNFKIEPHTEPEAKPEPEAVKLYCTANGIGDHPIKKGDICEFLAPHFIFPNGEIYPYEYKDMDDFCRRNPGYANAKFVPLVSRPAKVDEWVLVTSNVCNHLKTPNCEGRLMLVNRVKSDGRIYDKAGYTMHDTGYLVLDGYDGRYEKEKPKYYNGKVVCANDNKNKVWVTGTVYTIKNGRVINSLGSESPYNNDWIKSIEHMNKVFYPTKFIPYLGENT